LSRALAVSYKNSFTISHRYPTAHGFRVDFLDTLAVLAGCTENLKGQLPDGKQPDVLRVNRKHRTLFIGDAKDSETPNCQATRFRLFNYFRWLAVHMTKENTRGVFALCFGKAIEIHGWVETLTELAHETELLQFQCQLSKFGDSIIVTSLVFTNGIMGQMATKS